MSGVAITRRIAFISRVRARSGALTHADVAALEALWRAYDPLEFRQGAARAGFRLASGVTSIGGKICRHLVHRRAA